ncbi:hypothetical protein M0R45_029376 [Rubus argutus]|uniref:Disease resistance protein RGA3 n=1 Tax=Rubus argutus TaxID=59490 RepID=A0AAW1WBH5_RUBAR
MADFLLTFAAEGILSKVTSLAAQEFSLALDFKGDLVQLRESFLKIQALLRDVDHSQVRGEAVEMWVKNLEDIAHEADDVLDEIAYEDLRHKIEVQKRKKVQNFFSHNPAVFRLKMAHKIKKINTCLVKLNNEAAGPIGLVARTLADNATSNQVLDRETFSGFDPDEKCIIGRDEVLSDIVKTLTKSSYGEDNCLPVLAIVGMAGLGKTTLAKSIYHRSEIDAHFNEKIWVCVSTPFEVKKILRGILESLKPEKAAAQSKDAICKFLREELKEKRYLLVLDDVWNEDPEKWRELRSCLSTVNDTRGSSIIVTTRSGEVAKVMEALPRCDLKKLSDDECWLILKDKAVPVGSAPISAHQQTIGREIAKKCGGLPLVARVLGHMMRFKTSDEWRAIVETGILGRLTNLRSLPFVRVCKETGPGIEELGGVNQLRGTLSIHNLEHVTDREVAEKANLVEKKHARKLILVWRPNNNGDNHDDVLEGLQPHSSLEFLEIQGFMGVKFPSWLLLANNLKEIELLGCNNCQRLPVLGHLPNLRRVKVKNMENLTCIGSEFYGAGTSSSKEETRWALFPALKTLHIENAGELIDWMEAPASSCRVFPCLEELTLIDCDQLTSAPTHFPSLQKLVVEGDFLCNSTYLDEESDSGMAIASILSNQLTTLTSLEISSVKGLTCLPEGMLENNKNLEHLSINHCQNLTCISPQSQGFGYCCAKLSYLEIWDCENLRYLPDGLLSPSLKKLSLHCEGLEYIPDITHGGLTSLETLTISYCSKITSISPISQGGLPSLRELEIDSCPELFLPSGLESFPSLEKLTIENCPRVVWSSLSTSSLQELCVSNLESLPTTLHGGFASLRQFTIQGCKSPQIENSAFLQTLVSVQQLNIRFCENLETLPSLDKLTSLRSLAICDCYSLKCLPNGLAASSVCSLTRLKTLTIGRLCMKLESFPAFQAIPQLKRVTNNFLSWSGDYARMVGKPCIS